MKADTILMCSAASLEQLAGLVRQRWGWRICEFHPTDKPTLWNVERYDGLVEDLSVRRSGRRYRLELTTSLPRT